jgi:RNA polymerase sigma-70 factor, ECF subfamily
VAAAPHIRALCHVEGKVSTVALPPFWSLVEAYGGELLVHARRIAGDAHGEDVLQDAVLRALRAYPRLRHAEHLRAWLYRVTTTTALDHLRARRREVLTAEPPAAVAEPEHYDDAFESLIGALPDGTRAALRLRFVEDLDYQGIAARLGCSPAAARQRVSTAIRTLRTQGIPA